MAITSPYIALTISTISRGEVNINASCDVRKLDFWLWLPAPVAKWLPRAWISASKYTTNRLMYCWKSDQPGDRTFTRTFI